MTCSISCLFRYILHNIIIKLYSTVSTPCLCLCMLCQLLQLPHLDTTLSFFLHSILILFSAPLYSIYSSSLSSASFLSTPMCLMYFLLVFCLLPLNTHVPYILPPCLLPPSSQHPCALCTSPLSSAPFLSMPMCLMYFPLVFCPLPLNAHVPYVLPPCLLPPSPQHPCALCTSPLSSASFPSTPMCLMYFPLVFCLLPLNTHVP